MSNWKIATFNKVTLMFQGHRNHHLLTIQIHIWSSSWAISVFRCKYWVCRCTGCRCSWNSSLTTRWGRSGRIYGNPHQRNANKEHADQYRYTYHNIAVLEINDWLMIIYFMMVCFANLQSYIVQNFLIPCLLNKNLNIHDALRAEVI